METLKAYIWDMDGTLIDSYDAIVSALADVAEACGVQDSPGQILRAVKQESVSGYLRDLSAGSGKSTETLYQMYRAVGHANDDQITLIPGAAETLKVLQDQGAKHFVYTHRGSTTRPLLERLGIREHFTETVTSENGFRPKPSGEGVEYLLEKYALDRMKTAYVGDRALDVLCAKDAGVQAVLYLPADSCVIPTGKEDRIVRELTELTDGVHLLACGKDYRLLRLLGHGKGGYSYLAEADGKQAVLKQIHHEACDYYTFGNKIEAERHDLERLRHAGIRIPEMIAVDDVNERVVKEYIEGPTVFELIRDGGSAEPYLDQVREMAAKAKAAGLNIDYFPTNFVIRDGLIWYIDYECNGYMEEWNFENWGVRYWSRTPEFTEYLKQHPEMSEETSCRGTGS